MASSEFPQQSGRRQVVVLHVVGDVVEVQAEADLRGLVADGVGAFEDISPQLRLVQIGAPVVGRWVRMTRSLLVYDVHFMAILDERVDDM